MADHTIDPRRAGERSAHPGSDGAPGMSYREWLVGQCLTGSAVHLAGHTAEAQDLSEEYLRGVARSMAYIAHEIAAAACTEELRRLVEEQRS